MYVDNCTSVMYMYVDNCNTSVMYMYVDNCTLYVVTDRASQTSGPVSRVLVPRPAACSRNTTALSVDGVRTT